ncbi:MAG: hypothetical protein ABII22_02875 [Candidatus Micrarchaeota archaeon]
MGLSDLFKGIFGRGDNFHKAKCPSCGESLYFDMHDKEARCPKCGTHIYSMFKKRCPKCNEANELNAKECVKCRCYFEDSETRSSKKSYRCPLCKYKSDSFMVSCPACGARFG